MDIFFENRYYCNHKMLAEFGRKYSVGPRPVMVALLIAAFAYFVIDSWWEGILLEMLPMLTFMAVIFGSMYFLADLFAWSSLRNAKKQHDNMQPESVITFGDVIEVHEGMVRITLEYRKIRKVVRLKHCYLLMNGKRTGIMLREDGFTKGTFPEFKQFLREKCPDITIPE